MPHATFSLAIDEHGSCTGFGCEDTQLLHTRHPGCIVQIELPLPPGAAAANVTVPEHSAQAAASAIGAASAWLALDADGGCVAFAGSESDLPDVREAAERYAGHSGLRIAVVRVEVPLPAGRARARVTPA